MDNVNGHHLVDFEMTERKSVLDAEIDLVAAGNDEMGSFVGANLTRKIGQNHVERGRSEQSALWSDHATAVQK